MDFGVRDLLSTYCVCQILERKLEYNGTVRQL
jgi:hypothetical protein